MLIYVFAILQGSGILVFILLCMRDIFQGIKKQDEKGYTKLKRYIILAELMIAVIEIMYVHFAPDLPVIGGTSIGAVYHFGDEKFYLSYRTSGRSYSDKVMLDEAELQHVFIKCECEAGNVYVKFEQETEEKIMDVTNYEGDLELEKFEAGNVKISTYNDHARDVKLEITWGEI